MLFQQALGQNLWWKVWLQPEGGCCGTVGTNLGTKQSQAAAASIAFSCLPASGFARGL